MAEYDEIINAVRIIAKNEQPDIDISDMLQIHKCFYFLARLPKTEAEKDMAFNKVVIWERYRTCAPVFSAIKNIPYAVIKGAVLSQAAHGDIIYRRSGDIDLLVSRDNIDKLLAIMRENGFVQGRISDDGIIPFTRKEILFHSSMTHQTAPFIKKTNNILCPYVKVDINMEVLWGEKTIKSNMDYILSNTVLFNVCGVEVYKLDTVMEFISLCLHHYKDMNSIYLLSQGSLKLYLFCDIYFYLINNSVDIAELSEKCGKLNVAEYVYYCVYYANMIFNDTKLDEYLFALKNEKCENILDTFGLDNDERKVWDIPFCKRLFSENFLEKFKALLTEKDIEKIRKNLSFM